MNPAYHLIAMRQPLLSDIPGLYFELDATRPDKFYSNSTLTTLAVPNGGVAGVKDVSGAGLGINATQSGAATLFPTYTLNAINGRPALSFDGGDWLAVNALAPYVTGSDKPFSLAAAIQFSSVAAARTIFSFGRAATNNTMRYIGCNATALWFFVSNDDADTTEFEAVGSANTNAHIMVFLFSGTTVTLLIDGVTIWNELAHNVSTCTLDIATIGLVRTLATAVQGCIGTIGHLAIWPTRRISNLEAIQATHLLGRKWGVATT